MKRNFLLIGILFLATFAVPVLGYYNPGNSVGFVSDFGAMLGDISALESKLNQFEKETSNEISVVTINSLAGDTIENFAVKLFEEWGIGKADKDNGILILISKEDREMRIEVGYGLEGALTDAQSYWIIQNIMTPEFKAGDYLKGIDLAADKIIAATKGEYVPSANNIGIRSSGSIFKVFSSLIFFFLLWMLSPLILFLGKTKSWWLGGVLGCLAGAFSILFFGWVFGVLAMLFLTPFGLLFDYVVSKIYPKIKISKDKNHWRIIGGGHWPGGGGGGGFGGFGGGSSGGGGASGRW